jgi:hypothetical protein
MWTLTDTILVLKREVLIAIMQVENKSDSTDSNCNKCVIDKAKLVHNLFLLYLTISTCLGQLYADHQEKQLCL